MTTYETLLNAYECSTMNNNLFEKVVKSLSTSSYKDGANTTYNFADGSSMDCDNLNPFKLNYATFVSSDLSFVSELKKSHKTPGGRDYRPQDINIIFFV